jgi:hypothetical protein
VETLDICEAYHDKSAKDYRADYDGTWAAEEGLAGVRGTCHDVLQGLPSRLQILGHANQSQLGVVWL